MSMCNPPLLTEQFHDAIKSAIAEDPYPEPVPGAWYYWLGRYQPIESEL